MKYKFLVILFVFSGLYGAGDSYVQPDLGMAYVIPFIGMLLSIALTPLIAPHFWEKNYG